MSSGVASRRVAPLTSTRAMSAMRSASLTFCSIITTVTPSALTDLTLSKISATNFGERPADGSSSSRTVGPAIMAQAKAKHLPLPARELAAAQPEPPGDFREHGEHGLAVLGARAAVALEEFSRDAQILPDRQVGEDVELLRHVGKPGRHALRCGEARDRHRTEVNLAGARGQ